MWSTFQTNLVYTKIIWVNTERENTQSQCDAHRDQTAEPQWESHLKVDMLPCSVSLFSFWLLHRYAVWSLQSDAKCLSPCLLRAPLLGKAITDEYLKLSLTEIDRQGQTRCALRMSPILVRWPNTRTLKTSSKILNADVQDAFFT